MSTKPTPSSLDVAAATPKGNGPGTMVVAGILALALGGLGVAALMTKSKPQPLAATESAEETAAKAKAQADQAAIDAAAAALARGETPAKATLTLTPKEDPALDAHNQGAGASTGPSAFPENDVSSK